MRIDKFNLYTVSKKTNLPIKTFVTVKSEKEEDIFSISFSTSEDDYEVIFDTVSDARFLADKIIEAANLAEDATFL